VKLRVELEARKGVSLECGIQRSLLVPSRLHELLGRTLHVGRRTIDQYRHEFHLGRWHADRMGLFVKVPYRGEIVIPQEPREPISVFLCRERSLPGVEGANAGRVA
jgi:hypothetical protein